MKTLYKYMVLKYWNEGMNLPNEAIKYYMQQLGPEVVRNLPIGFASAIAAGMYNWDFVRLEDENGGEFNRIMTYPHFNGPWPVDEYDSSVVPLALGSSL